MLGLKLIQVGIRLVYCRNNRRRIYLGASFEIRYPSIPVKYCVIDGLDCGANILYLTVEAVCSSVDNFESAILANSWATHTLQDTGMNISNLLLLDATSQLPDAVVYCRGKWSKLQTYVVYCWVQCYTYESLALDRMLSPAVFISGSARAP